MTITTRAYEGIKILEGSETFPFNGKPRFRSTVKRTGDIPLIDLKKAAEAASMSLRRHAFARRAE